MIRIRVPATTANVGPGFDCVGIALSCYALFQFECLDETKKDNKNHTMQPQPIITGCENQYANKDNLVYQAYLRTVAAMHQMPLNLSIHIDSDIPLSRGLGSSAACIVAGVCAGNALHGNLLTKEDLFAIATQMEGHPDNIAPAMFGGMQVSMTENEMPYHLRVPLHDKFSFSACIPAFTLSTSKARAVLPKQVSLQDAVHNIGRTAMVLRTLEEGNEQLLSLALHDKLHEPYRMQLIEEYQEVQNICRNHHSLGFFISGAGPTLMNIVENKQFSKQIEHDIGSLKNHWKVVPLEVDAVGVTIEMGGWKNG